MTEPTERKPRTTWGVIHIPSPKVPARIKHGLFVRAADGLKTRDRKVTRLAQKMRVTMPWLEPSDMPAARAWAELEVLTGQVYATLRSIGIANGKGEPRRLLTDYRQLRQAQLTFARELGMTPAARMAIKATSTNQAIDLAGAFAAHASRDDDK